MKETDGFTLVEVLASVFLVSLAIILVSGTIINTLALTGYSSRKFRTQCRLDNLKEEMRAEGFNSDCLAAGRHNRQDGLFQIQWEVSVISPWLKEVRMRVRKGECECRGFFYISKLI